MRSRSLSLALGAMLLGACAGETFDLGVDAKLRVEAGRFVRDKIPEENGGPNVLGAYLSRTTLHQGEQGTSYYGVVEPNATRVFVGLEGDTGFWGVDVGPPPPESPDTLGFSADFSLSRDLGPGSYRLLTWAIDELGQVGAPSSKQLTIVAPTAEPSQLQVSLLWSGRADLDLHLVLPNGSEIFAGDPVYREEEELIGALERDTNAECDFDGSGREDIVFRTSVPKGTFLVRVETSSLCDDASAPFTVEISRQGTLIATTEGVSLPSDTRFAKGRGAGRLMANFQEP